MMTPIKIIPLIQLYSFVTHHKCVSWDGVEKKITQPTMQRDIVNPKDTSSCSNKWHIVEYEISSTNLKIHKQWDLQTGDALMINQTRDSVA